MEERIGSVKLNYDFYSGDDSYSDGDVENTILDIVKAGAEIPPEDRTAFLEKKIEEENDWAVLYHLSDIRKNILEWYDMKENATVLEIGAGCGAITGVLCKKAKEVTCIDLSKRRSMINAYRNIDSDNLTLYVGNFKDIKLDQKFDYVTLIGVLEYSIYYVGGDNPFMEMISRAKDYLAPGGKLIIAIENKYGLKYWAGAAEDHTGKRFDGITGYNGVEIVRTFSRETLEKMLMDSGFEGTSFYYPVPDYKMPLEIYSDKRLPKKGSIKSVSANYDRERYLYFDEVKAFDSICEDGLFPTFANSFLVVADTEKAGAISGNEVLYAKFNSLRDFKYRMETRIVRKSGARYVDKIMLCPQGDIERLAKNREIIGKLYNNIKTVPGKVQGNSMRYSYVKGKVLGSDIDYSRDSAEEIAAKIEAAIEKLQDYRQECVGSFEISEGYKKLFGDYSATGERAVCPANLDEIMSNCIETDDKDLYIIDYEWVVDFPVPIRYLNFRVYYNAYCDHMNELKDRISFEELMKAGGFSKNDLDFFMHMEDSFQAAAYGTDSKRNYTTGCMKPVHDLDKLLQHKDNLLMLKTQQYELEHERIENVRHAIRNPIYGARLAGGVIKRKVSRKNGKRNDNK